MIPRVRMARKRMMIARERYTKARNRWCLESSEISRSAQCAWVAYQRWERTLRAIERRKDRIV